jgi:hypothetical protein
MFSTSLTVIKMGKLTQCSCLWHRLGQKVLFGCKSSNSDSLIDKVGILFIFQFTYMSPGASMRQYSRNRSHITIDSQSASQSWCQALIRDPRQIFLFEIFFRQLRAYFVAPSLTRGRIYNLLLPLVHASAVTPDLSSLTRGHVCHLSSFC